MHKHIKNIRLQLLASALLTLLMLFLMGCSKTTSSDSDEYYINNVLDKVEQAFNNHDIDALMPYIHVDYLHNGMTRWQIKEVWLDRMAQYLLIDFQNVNIEIDHDKATVHFTMKLQNENETVFTEEPTINGDLSYFVYDAGHWSVYGNQHNY